MPQASDKLRAQMKEWFDDGISDSGPYAVLKAKGWTDDGGLLSPPTPSYYGPREDYILLKFLHDEWDYDWKSAPLWNDG